MTPGTPADPARLRRLVGAVELAWVIDRARERLATGGALTGRVTLSRASPAQQQAIARLLGRRLRAGSDGGALSVRLEDVDAVLRRSGAAPDGLADAVVSLTGPVSDRLAERTEQIQAWDEVFAELSATCAGRPGLTQWAEGLRARGLLRRVTADAADAGALVADLIAVLRALPAGGEPIGVFARRVLGSAHALDENERLARLLVGPVRVLAGGPDGPDGLGSSDGPDHRSAAVRREAWAAVGVLRDDLSSTTLTLGLPGDEVTVTGTVLDAWASAGQPVVLTLRQLVHDPPRWDLRGRLVSVCEGPVVVSLAADRLGPRCAPLVCVGGQPGVATMLLLRLLVHAGARLRYHGDFDWGGLRIAQTLVDRVAATPWRFDAASYRAAAGSDLAAPLRGTPTDASGDPDLADAMREVGRQVEEEAVVDDLLADLRRE